ncbi:DUF190 domain-containing protein [Deinococcus sp. UYEF24]
MNAGLSLLRIYLIAGDHMEGRVAAEAIIEAARTLNATLASTQPGIFGFGRHGLEVDLLLLKIGPEQTLLTVQVLGPEDTLEALLENLRERRLPDREAVPEQPTSVCTCPSGQTNGGRLAGCRLGSDHRCLNGHHGPSGRTRLGTVWGWSVSPGPRSVDFGTLSVTLLSPTARPHPDRSTS